MKRRCRQAGLGAIAVILILLVLGSLSAAIVSFSSGEQLGSALDIQSVRAWQAASAGTEWGLARALQANDCSSGNWLHPDYPDMRVTVVCTSHDYTVGEAALDTPRKLRVFHITATACNGQSGSCPDAGSAAQPLYVERQRLAIAYCSWNGAACETGTP
jgi:MSHA biogenesis protein MshP